MSRMAKATTHNPREKIKNIISSLLFSFANALTDQMSIDSTIVRLGGSHRDLIRKKRNIVTH